MKTKIVEATNGPQNFGKFMVGVFEADEWMRKSAVDLGRPLLVRVCGWTPAHVWVLDLQTGEGALFMPTGLAKADLDKHQIWVCPLFEPFLTWLYAFAQENWNWPWHDKLPEHIDLPNAPFDYAGYRRKGPEKAGVEPATDR